MALIISPPLQTRPACRRSRPKLCPAQLLSPPSLAFLSHPAESADPPVTRQKNGDSHNNHGGCFHRGNCHLLSAKTGSDATRSGRAGERNRVIRSDTGVNGSANWGQTVFSATRRMTDVLTGQFFLCFSPFWSIHLADLVALHHRASCFNLIGSFLTSALCL